MIPNHYYRIIKYSIFLLSFSFLFSKSYSPMQLDLSENLIHDNNEREYFVLYNSSLNYEIEGPIRLEIISRRAIPQQSKRKYEFGYKISLNDSKPIEVKHKKYKKENLFSDQHPGHGYTQSGNAIVNLPNGNHSLNIIPLYEGKPTLVRIIKEVYKKSKGITESITPQSKNNDSIIMDDFIIKDSKRKYFKLQDDQTLFLMSSENESFSIYGRTNKYSKLVENNYYQFEVLEGERQKNIIIDFFKNESNIQKQKIYQLKSNKNSELSFNLLDSNVPVYLRIIKNTPYE